MSRLKVVAASPKLLLGSLVTMLAAVGLAVGSGASFTSHSANPANTFSSGNLAQTNSTSGAVLTAAKIKPGDAASTGTVTITNSGDIAGAFTLTKSAVADTAGPNGGQLSSKLTVLIQDVTTATPVQVYTGTVGAMGAQSLGNFAAGASRTYKFSVTFPDGGTPASSTTGDNAYKGSALSVDYAWDSAS